MLVSATFQNFPGPEIAANYLVTNAVASPSLGRPLAGNAPNIGVNIVQPMSAYENRVNQLDLRFGKLIRYGRTRSTVSIDLYNALNANPVLTENLNDAAFRVPTSILVARFAKVTWQFDF